MKLIATIRCKLLIGLLVTVFSATALADDDSAASWAKEGVDWSQYSKFIVKPLEMDDVRLIPPPWAENTQPLPQCTKAAPSSTGIRASEATRV